MSEMNQYRINRDEFRLSSASSGYGFRKGDVVWADLSKEDCEGEVVIFTTKNGVGRLVNRSGNTQGYALVSALTPIDEDTLTESAEVTEEVPHYNTSSIEVIDAIEEWDLGFNLGNVVKYVARAGKKTEDTSADLVKAYRYLYREIHGEWPSESK